MSDCEWVGELPVESRWVAGPDFKVQEEKKEQMFGHISNSLTPRGFSTNFDDLHYNYDAITRLKWAEIEEIFDHFKIIKAHLLAATVSTKCGPNASKRVSPFPF